MCILLVLNTIVYFSLSIKQDSIGTSMVQFDDTQQNQQLKSMRLEEEERLIEILSTKYNLPYIQLSAPDINIQALGAIKEEDARTGQVAPFQIKKNKYVDVAVYSPNLEETKAALKQIRDKGFVVNVYMASHKSLEKVWTRYRDYTLTQKTNEGVVDISGDKITILIESVKSIAMLTEMINKEIENKTAHQMSNIFAYILAGAFTLGASDIHTEPQEGDTRVRYRLDGILHDVAVIPEKIYRLLGARIKLLAGLKLNIDSDTQDGRFSIRFKESEVEIRVSVLPGNYGEAVVMRILDPASIQVPLEELGMDEHFLQILKRQINKPTGMILTTGPTGSGKTTTLYAVLRKILDPEIKIITIEDPIEYHIGGLSQTQIDNASNYTFLSGLRAALRQDPDVIMIGEIRDGETAKIAINASLTGHLVFSTLHTNDAAGAVPRLLDLGVNAKVISSALNISMGQRLIRKLCLRCRVQITLSQQEKDIILPILENVKEKRPKETFTFDTVYRASDSGCAQCTSGYKGRVGIYEAVLMDKNVEKTVTDNPSTREIWEAAKSQGIFTMREDGIVKILNGTTSLSELQRVLDVGYIPDDDDSSF